MQPFSVTPRPVSARAKTTIQLISDKCLRNALVSVGRGAHQAVTSNSAALADSLPAVTKVISDGDFSNRTFRSNVYFMTGRVNVAVVKTVTLDAEAKSVDSFHPSTARRERSQVWPGVKCPGHQPTSTADLGGI